MNILDVNAHIHTPYSFSSFTDVEQAVKMAADEGIKVLGINDFFVTEGYAEFAEKCKKYNIFPLFNIEFIGVIREAQQNNIKINDPGNPGRIYVSGKGLKFNPVLPVDLNRKLQSVKKASQEQIEGMIEKLNEIIEKINPGLKLSMDEIYKRFAKDLIRERHLAKAIRVKVDEAYSSDMDRLNFYTKLFEQAPKSSINNFSAIENEIRSKLLKAGGKAFIAEDEKAFMSLQEIDEIIKASGGITTYPLLLDGTGGDLTDFEGNKEELLHELQKNGIFSIEFIPGRNNIDALEDYVKFFYDNGFIVTLGTEHNTPDCPPIKISCKGGVDLSNYLKEINYKGACVVAANQYLTEKEDIQVSLLTIEKRTELEKLGDEVISKYLKN